MRIHTVTQIEYDDGSMSRPMTSVQVFDVSPKLRVICRVGTGIVYSDPDMAILAHTDSTIRFFYTVDADTDYLRAVDAELDLCFEQEHETNPELLTHKWTKKDHIAFQTPATPDTVKIGFVLADKYGGTSNKVWYTVRVV